ncbi:MAG: hypothetical protein WC890_04080 [Candidatus Margulisiibacteriota bacterium]
MPMKILIILIVLFTAVVAVFALFNKSDSVKLANLIAEIEKKQPIKPEEVVKILGFKLNIASQQPNPYFVIRTGKAENGKYIALVDTVELRTPKDTGKGGLLIIDLNNKQKTNAQYFEKLYPNHAFELASATAPLSVPNAIIVKKSWGTLRLGVSRDGSSRIQMLSFDAVKKS